MNACIPLWPGEVPYADASPGQAPPTVAEFKAEKSRGALVVCPGGGYAGKAEHEGEPIALMLNAAGISAYVLDYRVSPCHYLSPLTDARRAVRVVRALGYQKVGIIGFSAGGHLACSAATLCDGSDAAAADPIERLSSRPDALVACYPVVTFGEFTDPDTRENLLRARREDPDLLRRFSIEKNVTPDAPPAFLWHTADDQVVPVENSLLLARALSANGVPFELHVFPEGPHGLGLAAGIPGIEQWPSLCQTWLLGQGFGR